MLAACLWAKLPILGLTQAPDLSPRSPQHIPPLMCFSWKHGPSTSQPHVLLRALPTLLPWDPASGQHAWTCEDAAQLRSRVSAPGCQAKASRSNNEKGKLHPVPDEGQITSATKKKELALGDRMYIFLMYRSTEDIGDLWFSNGLHSVPPSCHLGYSSLHLHLLSSWF